MKQIISDKQFILIVIANFLSSVGSGISTIAVSWLLVNQTNGEIILGYTLIGTTIIMFLIAPYIGVLIDRFSRYLAISHFHLFLFVILCFTLSNIVSTDPGNFLER